MLKLPNFYDQIYIVCYPRGAGGNFLINCLGLHDDCVFSNAELASLQLQEKFDLTAKVNYLQTQLYQAEKTKVWNDLNLGNGQLFGISGHEVQNTFTEILAYKINSVVEDVIQAKKKIFFICHNVLYINSLQKIWPNLKIIFFTNFSQFILQRPAFKKPLDTSPELLNYWNTVKDISWTHKPPRNNLEFSQLPHHVKDELLFLHKFNISRWFDFTDIHDQLWHKEASRLHTTISESSFLWDVNKNYFSADNLLKGLNLLSKKFHLRLVDNEIIKWYFYQWKTIINN